ncbi:adenine deaminase [Paenibacillus bovis]|uniref:Adenine deaminase n=1 Tax=Paenibacillus bovis TaxID=1616788 RepID=A0A172ZG06_9BACL|nr:adenine deaminase [Paenibacillus bovis]ANF96312.1 adenine deaminase [Paenibacillus bovis]
MKWTAEALKRRIDVASHRVPADTVIQGGQVVNVFTGELMQQDIAIVDGVIAGIGSYQGRETINAAGKWIIPGLIDGHVHIESSMLSPQEFAKVVIQHGVTSVITDPHEIGSVAGVDGIRYMLEQSENLPVDQFIMLPSCVPATSFESSAACLEAEDLEPFYDHPRVLGLAEVMDFGALSSAAPGMLGKIASAHTRNKYVDGHAAGIAGEQLSIYATAGIRTDHECIHAEEARQRLELGMYVLIREGTAAKDLEAILPVITPYNSRRCLFVTDDKLIDDLLDEGSVDHNIRLAIRHGLPAVTAIQMATLNTAECFGLRDRGAVAPCYIADLVILDDLEQLTIHEVYKNGKCVVQGGRLLEQEQSSATKNNVHSIQTGSFGSSGAALSRCQTASVTLDHLALPLTHDHCNVIEIIPNSLVTTHAQYKVDRKDGYFTPSTDQDLLKLAVVERHQATGNIGLGIVKGFHLQKGAIVSTVAHDSHNLIAAGTSDEEILLAIEHIVSVNGGLAVVSGSEVLASLPLSIAGLLSELPYEEVYRQMKKLNQALLHIGAAQHFNPFLMLSFLALPVIPTLKLTDLGLFDFASNSHIPVEVQPQMKPASL